MTKAEVKALAVVKERVLAMFDGGRYRKVTAVSPAKVKAACAMVEEVISEVYQPSVRKRALREAVKLCRRFADGIEALV